MRRHQLNIQAKYNNINKRILLYQKRIDDKIQSIHDKLDAELQRIHEYNHTYKHYVWKELRVLWFHRCLIYKKIIWPGQKAFAGRLRLPDGRMLDNVEWMSAEGFLFARLQGKV